MIRPNQLPLDVDFGDSALTLFHHLIDGFHNTDPCSHVADLLGVSSAEYTSNQMTYDLRRLRLKGLLILIDSRVRNCAERSACLVFRRSLRCSSAAPPEDILQAPQSFAAFGMRARA